MAAIPGKIEDYYYYFGEGFGAGLEATFAESVGPGCCFFFGFLESVAPVELCPPSAWVRALTRFCASVREMVTVTESLELSVSTALLRAGFPISLFSRLSFDFDVIASDKYNVNPVQ
jgi:hypothetical protein